MFWNPAWIVAILLNCNAAFTNLGPAPAAAAGTAIADSAAAIATASEPDFPLRAGDQPVAFPVMAEFVLPGEMLELEVESAVSGYQVTADAGSVAALGPNRWGWRAPLTPGAYPVRVTDPEDGGSYTLNVFVMVPYSRMRNGVLAGHRIGSYPAPRGARAAFAERPPGFIEVTAENQDVQVAPHFRLGQFLCKDDTTFPHYLVLKPSLLVKLERLLEVVNRHGIEAETFQLMSAYRTPAYNRAIGNSTTLTRHQYGDAADIFIDQDGDGRMDDLNGDRREDRRDAELLSAWAEDVEQESRDLVGGLSSYRATAAHGPFVHVDARGYLARW